MSEPAMPSPGEEESRIEAACNGLLDLCRRFFRTLWVVPSWPFVSDLKEKVNDRRLLGPFTFLSIGFFALSIATSVELHSDESQIDYLKALSEEVTSVESLANVFLIVGVYVLLMLVTALLTWQVKKYPELNTFPFRRLATYTAAWSFFAFSIVWVVTNSLTRLPRPPGEEFSFSIRDVLTLFVWILVIGFPGLTVLHAIERSNAKLSRGAQILMWGGLLVFQYMIVGIGMLPVIWRAVQRLERDGTSHGNWPVEGRLQYVKALADNRTLEVLIVIQNKKKDAIVLDPQKLHAGLVRVRDDVSKPQDQHSDGKRSVLLPARAVRVPADKTPVVLLKSYEMTPVMFEIAPPDSWYLDSAGTRVKEFFLTVRLPQIRAEGARTGPMGSDLCVIDLGRATIQ